MNDFSKLRLLLLVAAAAVLQACGTGSGAPVFTDRGNGLSSEHRALIIGWPASMSNIFTFSHAVDFQQAGSEAMKWAVGQRTVTAIGKRHESLARHLTVSIMSGLTFRYAPEREIEWLV